MRFPGVVLLVLAVLSGFGNGQAAAQSYCARPLAAVRAAQPPVIDGDLSEAAWKQAAVAGEFIDPYTGKPTTEQTTAYLLYDDSALYVAFYCRDSQPDSIVAREIQQGASLSGDDCVRFEIDPFYTRSGNTSVFCVNPRGTQYESIASGRAAKQEWRGVWQAAARRMPDGWAAEMRIPWEVLNYPGGGSLKMGVNFHRIHARPHVFSSWSDLTPNGRPENIGVWSGVTPPARALRRTWQGMTYVSPLLGGGSAASRSGLDVRYTPTPQLTGVLSVNPDFRSVEQDVTTIAFSRSEIYQGDSRPFFMEGRWLFENSLFYSRRIGDFDAGAKVFGNLNDRFTFGLLSAFRGMDEHATVATAQYALPKGSSLSLAGTLRRSGEPGHEGLMANSYLRFGTWRWLTAWAHAREGREGGHSLMTAFAYTAPHWWVDMHWEQVDPGYSPSLGLRPFVNYRGPLLSASYDNVYRHGPLRSLFLNTTLYRFNHYDGSLFQDHFNTVLRLETRSDHFLVFNAEASRFEQTHDRYYSLLLAANVSNRYRQMAISYDWGTRADRAYGYVSMGVTRRLFGGLDVSLSGSVLRHIQNREQYILTLGREFDSRRALNMRLVQQDGSLNGYLAFRSAGGVGQDVYLIFGDPNARSFTRQVALKWVWAL